MARAVPQQCPSTACMWPTRRWAATRARQDLRSYQLSLPRTPLILSASATLRTSCHLHALPLQVPQLLDMVVSQVVPVASLTFSGRVIIFPE